MLFLNYIFTKWEMAMTVFNLRSILKIQKPDEDFIFTYIYLFLSKYFNSISWSLWLELLYRICYEDWQAFFLPYLHEIISTKARMIILYIFLNLIAYFAYVKSLKGTQDWEFFWLRFWNLRYFFVTVYANKKATPRQNCAIF
jgi:hypothetical protein